MQNEEWTAKFSGLPKGEDFKAGWQTEACGIKCKGGGACNKECAIRGAKSSAGFKHQR